MHVHYSKQAFIVCFSRPKKSPTNVCSNGVDEFKECQVDITCTIVILIWESVYTLQY